MREDYVPDELAGLGLADLAANFADFWAFAGRRADAGPAMQIVQRPRRGGERIDRLDIVQDDSPVPGRQRDGRDRRRPAVVRAMFHGMVDVARDQVGAAAQTDPLQRESMILVMLGQAGRGPRRPI